MSQDLGTIFINYRKSDANLQAGYLYSELKKYFHKDQLFKDFNTILPGTDFEKSINEALMKCDVLLVCMGKSWLNATNEKGERRLDDPNDFVRLEIATALQRDIPTVPVLFDDTSFPAPHELPVDLRGLNRRQYVEIETNRFEEDTKKLADAILTIFRQKGIHTAQPHDVLTAQQAGGQAGTRGPQQRSTPVAGNTQQARDLLGSVAAGTKPANNLVWAILATVLCCLPMGIVSIIYATKVDTLWNNGQHDEAIQAANKAKQWAIYSAAVGIIIAIIYGVYIAMMGNELMNSSY
jgi:hypothetical protein